MSLKGTVYDVRSNAEVRTDVAEIIIVYNKFILAFGGLQKVQWVHKVYRLLPFYYVAVRYIFSMSKYSSDYATIHQK